MSKLRTVRRVAEQRIQALHNGDRKAFDRLTLELRVLDPRVTPEMLTALDEIRALLDEATVNNVQEEGNAKA